MSSSAAEEQCRRVAAAVRAPPPPSARRRQPVCCCSRLRRRRPPPQCPRSRGQNQSYIMSRSCRAYKTSMTPWHDRPAFEPALLCRRFESRWSCPRGATRIARVCACDKTRREAEAEANVDVFAAAAAPRPPVCFGADAAPSLAARDGAAAASAPRSTALQQRAVQSGYRHDSWRRRLFRFPVLGTTKEEKADIAGKGQFEARSLGDTGGVKSWTQTAS